MRHIFLTVTICLAAALTIAPVAARVPQPAPVQPVPPIHEVRGLWVLAGSLSTPGRIAAMVRDATSSGVNTLLVQVRGRGEAYYRSAIDPRASDLDTQPADFDPLAVTIDLAHRAGLRVHAWVDVSLVLNSGMLPRSRDHVASRHPEWLMVPRALADPLRAVDVHSPGYLGALVRWTRSANSQADGLYLSPLSPGAQDYAASVIGEIASHYVVDGILLDNVRYPNNTFDYSASSTGAFRAARLAVTSAADRQRLDQQSAVDPSAWPDAFPDAWSAFRRDHLTVLLSRLVATARTSRPGVVVSASVDPNADDARTNHLQPWREWTDAGLLDVICPMAYTTDLAEFTRVVTQVRALSGRTPVWAGIGANRLAVAGAADHVRAARRAGVAGVLLFSYDSLATADARQLTYFAGLRRVLLEPATGSGVPR